MISPFQPIQKSAGSSRKVSGLSTRRWRKLGLLAHTAGGAIETGAEIDRRGLHRIEQIVERRFDRIESLRRSRRDCLGMSLFLDFLFGVGLDILHACEFLVGSENCRLARLEPDISQDSGAVVVG